MKWEDVRDSIIKDRAFCEVQLLHHYDHLQHLDIIQESQLLIPNMMLFDKHHCRIQNNILMNKFKVRVCSLGLDSKLTILIVLVPVIAIG